jgi:hypothetical protein
MTTTNASATRRRSPKLSRPVTQAIADGNPFADAATSFDGFLMSISRAAHDSRMLLLLMTGRYGDVLGSVSTAEQILHWLELFSEVERQSDRLLERYLELLEVDETPTKEVTTP